MWTPKVPALTFASWRSKRDLKKQKQKQTTNNKQTRWRYDFVQNSMAVLILRTTAKVLCGLEGSLPSVPGYLSDLISNHPPCVHSAGPAASLLVLKLRKHRDGQWFSSHWLSPVPRKALPQSYESTPLTFFFFLPTCYFHVTC